VGRKQGKEGSKKKTLTLGNTRNKFLYKQGGPGGGEMGDGVFAGQIQGKKKYN